VDQLVSGIIQIYPTAPKEGLPCHHHNDERRGKGGWEAQRIKKMGAKRYQSG